MSADVNYCSYKTTVIISYLLFQNPCLLKYIFFSYLFGKHGYREEETEAEKERERGEESERERERSLPSTFQMVAVVQAVPGQSLEPGSFPRFPT